MVLSPLETIAIMLGVAIGCMITRFLPFLLFAKKTPPFILHLGTVLPTAMLGFLVVFCFKGTSFSQSPFGVPELIASLTVVVLQVWRKNMYLSIAVGTALYMLLVQKVFACVG